MSTIVRLPTELITQIAAGQVIDRPASVVKELVENSLDAGATQITIQLREGGKKSIIVTDNGQGISREELALSLERHSTSKLDLEKGLASIRTLGFRGEGLASIAAVAQLTIASHQANSESGWQLESRPGTMPGPLKAVGMPVGTKVQVLALFAQLPARYKFLKTVQSEIQQIVQVVVKLGLAHPQVGFTLGHHQKMVLNLPPNQTLEGRLMELFDINSEQLLPVSYRAETFSLTGSISRPDYTVATPQRLYWSVNGRPIQHPAFQQLIKSIYHHLTDPDLWPVGSLNLQLAADQLDVNIHPQKTDIQFANPEEIYNAIRKNLSETLGSPAYPPLTSSPLQLSDSQPDALYHPSANPKLLQWLKSLAPSWESNQTHAQPEILQAHNLYLFIPTAEGNLVVVDQHAAHERILYDQLLKAYQENQAIVPAQTLSQPLTLSLTAHELATIQENSEHLETLGFHWTERGPLQLQLTHIPQAMAAKQAQALWTGVIADLASQQPVTQVDSQLKRTMAYVACRSAIKAGDSLTVVERQKLYDQLRQTANPFTCPHGRPTHFVMTRQELLKKFHRV